MSAAVSSFTSTLAQAGSYLKGVMVGTPAVQGALQSGAPLASTAAGAATSGIFGTAGKLSITQLLGSGLTLASMAQSMRAGTQEAGFIAQNTLAQADALQFAATEDLFAAREEEIAGERDANNILDNVNRTIASQMLAASANGIDVSFGTPAAVAENTQKIGNIQASTTRNDAKIRAVARRRQSTERLLQRSAVLQSGAAQSAYARSNGINNAIATGAEAVFRRVNRG